MSVDSAQTYSSASDSTSFVRLVLRMRADGLVGTLVDGIEAHLPALRDSADCRTTTAEFVARFVAALELETTDPTTSDASDTRTAAARFGTMCARLRVDPVDFQAMNLRCFTLILTEALRLAAEEPSAGEHPVASDGTTPSPEIVTRWVSGIHEWVNGVMTDSFMRELVTTHLSSANVRQRLVNDFISGRANTLSPADQVTVGYPFVQHHLAMLLPQTPEGAANVVGRTVAAASGARDVFVLARDHHSSIVWIAQPVPWRASAVTKVLERLKASNVAASIADPCSGFDGFRSASEQLTQIEMVRSTMGRDGTRAVIEYREVLVEVLALRDPELARSFVARELGPLVADTDEAGRLRTTLETVYLTGSQTISAERLLVHEHTVRNRMRKISELIGAEDDRKAELLLALRLHRLLDATKD